MIKTINKKVTLVCPVCNKEFKVYVSWAKQGRKHCSRNCYIKTLIGKIPASTGKPRSKETVEKMRKSMIGKLSGDKHPMWKGGRFIDSRGYVKIYSPEHPRKDKMGYVAEHRLVMERQIGRFLGAKEVVHHRSKNKQDNRIEKLKLFKNNADHMRYHKKIRKGEAWE